MLDILTAGSKYFLAESSE